LAQDEIPPVDHVLTQLFAYSRQYQASLPSLSCDESITSQVVKDGKIKKEMKIESTLRELRSGTGVDPFTEQHEFRTVDGHPAKSHFEIPFFVQGGFANALGFSKEEQKVCYDYRLSKGEDGKTWKLQMALRPNAVDGVCKAIPEGYRKSVVLDRATGRVILTEREISAAAAKSMKEIFYVSVEYGPRKIGEETLWLPIRMSAHDPANEGRLTVTYSNYHRYTGSMTLKSVDPAADPH
jgi:hypothetical protein